MNPTKFSKPRLETPAAPRSGGKLPQQIGEGSYQATQDYQKSIKNYLEDADVAADARAARPADAAQAEDLKRAEQEGLSHSKSRTR